MTTVTLTNEEMATILEALRHANAEAYDRLFTAEDRGNTAQADEASRDVSRVRAIRRRLVDERTKQLGLAHRATPEG